MNDKILFIDRDGTIIIEPEDEQIDSLEKLEFVPGVIRNLNKIKKQLGYKLVMVSNQDGLGTDVYPQESFDLVQDKMLVTLKNEGIEFDEILLDDTFPEQNSPNRKPATGMVQKYLPDKFNTNVSFVVGDRLTDIELAKNMGISSIFLSNLQVTDNLKESCVLQTTSWDKIFEFLSGVSGKINVSRKTKETDINIQLIADGRGNATIKTGLGFFDHMLEQIARHSSVSMNIKVEGDLWVDEHHTVEDTAMVLGDAILQLLGDKKGIERYGFTLPMDESLAQVAIDFGGRPYIVWEAEFKREKIGDVPTELFFHFFKSFTDSSKATLNIKAEGNNEHHKIEGIFKAFGRSIKQAVQRDIGNNTLPSTKGVL